MDRFNCAPKASKYIDREPYRVRNMPDPGLALTGLIVVTLASADICIASGIHLYAGTRWRYILTLMHLQRARRPEPAVRAVVPCQSPAREDGRPNLATAARVRPVRRGRPRTMASVRCGCAGARMRLRGGNVAGSPDSDPWLQGAVIVVISIRGVSALIVFIHAPMACCLSNRLRSAAILTRRAVSLAPLPHRLW